MEGIKGRVALVTGASRGIGEAAARQLARWGATVVLADLREPEGAQVAAQIAGAMFMPLDVGCEQSWTNVVQTVVALHGRIDILVASAGIYQTASLNETSLAFYERIVRVNQVGVFLGMRAVLPAMRERGGSIINLSSTSGLRGNQNSIAYGASKWAVRGMTKVAAMEFGAYGIRVNSVHPGLIDTAMNHEEMGHERIREVGATVPLGRPGEADEVASVICFLASNASSYVTGAEFVVDGGSTAGVLRRAFDARPPGVTQGPIAGQKV
ncbi:glucose 1-dehydrogenase [uncultured Pseudacidovorax sp.]|uniref:SDR family NAD(P)-dependent oxidoreductase n=1 Tax=uncultured Pseudacidovorax sp. TaxID=679313 RepID=UPI0025CC89E3|nr:glucose 1-dehydrogenase [uncultured Pseudacidovorax sp.]